MTEPAPPGELPRSVLAVLAGMGSLLAALSLVSMLGTMLFAVTFTDGEVNEPLANTLGAAMVAVAALGVLGALVAVAAVSGGRKWIPAGVVPALLLAVPGIPGVRPAFHEYGDLIAIGFCAAAAVAYRPCRRVDFALHVVLFGAAAATFLLTSWSPLASGFLAFAAAFPALGCAEEISHRVFRSGRDGAPA